MTHLLAHGTYACGTVCSNQKHFPKDLKGQLKQIGNLLATWWRDKRAIHMLLTNASQTMEAVSRNSKGGPIDKQTPQCVEIYNKNMEGVDKQDQLRSYYSIGRKSKKWWRCCFWFLVQIAVLNSYIMYKNMPRPPYTAEPMTHFHYIGETGAI